MDRVPLLKEDHISFFKIFSDYICRWRFLKGCARTSNNLINRCGYLPQTEFCMAMQPLVFVQIIPAPSHGFFDSQKTERHVKSNQAAPVCPDVIRFKFVLGRHRNNPAVVRIDSIRIFYFGFLVCVFLDFYFYHLLNFCIKIRPKTVLISPFVLMDMDKSIALIYFPF